MSTQYASKLGVMGAFAVVLMLMLPNYMPAYSQVAPPVITTTLSASTIAVGSSVTDQATISGLVSPQSSGTIKFYWYASSDCTLDAAHAPNAVGNPFHVTANGVYGPSDPVVFGTAGSYSWAAVYSGDAVNPGATSACETLTVTSGSTTKASPSITTTLSSSTISVGGSVFDSSALSGATANAGGTVSYYLFPGSGTCTAAAGYNPLFGTVTVTNGIIPNSAPQTFNTVATYSWGAVYSGDANNNAATSACELLTVQKASPSITTTLSSSTISVGDLVYDSATLSGATSNAGGTVQWDAFATGNCTPAVGISPLDGPPVTVTNGVIPNSNTHGYTTAGSYSFNAIYSGDANNNGATSACEILTVTSSSTTSSTTTTSTTTKSTTTTSSSSTSTTSTTTSSTTTKSTTSASKGSPVMTTTLSANPATVGSSVTDQTTISGLVNPTSLGTIEFYWYTGSSCSTGQNAAGNPFHVNTDGIFGSGSVVFNTTGSYSWNAVYSGDANNNAATSACELLTVQKASPSITTTLSHTTILTDGEGGSVFDSATVSGGQNPTGNVNFFYKVPCPPASGGIGVGGNVPLSGGSATSDTLGFGTAGTLYYYAVYSGDANNNPATSACEALTIVNQKASPSITTTLFRTEGQPAATTAVGGSVFDSAHLAGATSSAGGTVQYELFSNGSCTGTPTNIFAPVPVNIGIAPNSAPQTFNTAGSFSWKAVYSGDLNNNGITSACEVLTVTSGGFSIPEFPLQPVLSVLVTVLMVSAYVIVRRKAVGARGLRPSG